MKLNQTLLALFVIGAASWASANTPAELSPFVGSYTLKTTVEGKCFRKAQAGFGSESHSTFSIDQVFVSDDGVQEADQISDHTIVNNIGFAAFDLDYLNISAKSSVMKDGMAGYPIGTRSEMFTLKNNELVYSKRGYQYGSFTPAVEIDAKASLQGDILTLKKREYYPEAAGRAKTQVTECIFQKNS